jgi:hypothetical protein
VSVAYAARRLTDAHRVAQARIALDSVGKLTAVWNTLLKPSNLNGYASYMTAMTHVVETGRQSSSQMAAAYYRAHRDLLDIEGDYDVILGEDAVVAAIQTSLLVMGPVRVKTLLGNGDTIATAMAKALLASAGSVTRMIADGGRSTIRENVLADKQARGWQRITDGDPCSFCQMLADRGAVYKDEDTAGGNDPYHDHCLCTVEPVYE